MTAPTFDLATTVRHPPASAALQAADRAVAAALESARADSTNRVYRTQWRSFSSWCSDVGLRPLPADPLTVARYLGVRGEAGVSMATLRQAASAITRVHEWMGAPSPCQDPGVRVLAVTEEGRNVVPLGEDVRCNQIVLEAGTLIRPPEIGILATVGVVSVPVYRRPIVGVAATGSEIVEPGNNPAAGQIRNSNGYSMMAQALRSGAQTRYLGIVEDDEAALNAVISRGLDECDVVLLSGGVSAGIYDLVQGAMRDCGVEIFFDRILMKPGKPLTFGALGKKLVFGLPGNPVSAVVGLELLVRPAVRKMQRMSEVHRPMVRGKLAQGFRQSPGRKQFVPARSEEVNGCWESRWVGHHGSADLFSLSRANSLFVVEAEVEALDAGAEVDIVLLEDW